MKRVMSIVLCLALILASVSIIGKVQAFSITTNTIAEGYSTCIDGSIIAYISNEALIGQDLNSNGDTNDQILSYYDLATNTQVNTGAAIDDEIPAVSGSTIAFKAAEWRVNQDLNNDRDLNDNIIFYYNTATRTLTNTQISTEYSVSLRGSIIAFEVLENKLGVDINGDGDLYDPIVMCYDLSTGIITNTQTVGFYPAIDGTIIAFQTSEPENGHQDLNGDGDAYDVVIRYYDIATQTPVNTGIVGYFPDNVNSVCSSLIVFQSEVGTICYYNIATGTLTNTGYPGVSATISGSIIASMLSEIDTNQDLNGDGDTLDDFVIRYYDLTTGLLTNTGIVGSNPSISGSIITFETYEGFIHEDLNQDGDMTDYFVRYIDLAEEPSSDSIPPRTIASITSGEIGSNGWYTSSVTLTLTATDSASGVSSITYKINSNPSVAVSSSNVILPLGNDGIYSVFYFATDNAANQETPGNIQVKIDTAAPTLTIAYPEQYGVYPLGTKLSFAAIDSGSGVNSIKGYLTDSTEQTLEVTSGYVPHPGVYSFIAEVKDNAGNTARIEQLSFVIYDPNGGFVTGGGWIQSSMGAYTINPNLEGKATFGFVSKYQKGANIPTGNTEFEFNVAGFKFKSTSYDWLVVAGTKAQFKGLGTINNMGNYGFVLTAEDGGNKGQDTFRIKIWDASTETIIYDNGAQSPIGGGSIIVHK
jgi:hypothetical protein